MPDRHKDVFIRTPAPATEEVGNCDDIGGFDVMFRFEKKMK